MKATNLTYWPERKVQWAPLSFHISRQKRVMPGGTEYYPACWQNRLTALPVAVPPRSGAGDWPEALHKYALLCQFPRQNV